jgi:hypothetical protein
VRDSERYREIDRVSRRKRAVCERSAQWAEQTREDFEPWEPETCSRTKICSHIHMADAQHSANAREKEREGEGGEREGRGRAKGETGEGKEGRLLYRNRFNIIFEGWPSRLRLKLGLGLGKRQRVRVGMREIDR